VRIIEVKMLRPKQIRLKLNKSTFHHCQLYKEKVWTLKVLFCCLLTVLLVGLVSFTSYAQRTWTWDGSTNNNWTTTDNWAVTGAQGDYPGGTSETDAIVVIDDGTNIGGGLSVSAGITIGQLTIQSDSVGTQDLTITCAGALTVTASGSATGAVLVGSDETGDAVTLVLGGTLTAVSLTINSSADDADSDATVTADAYDIDLSGDFVMTANGEGTPTLTQSGTLSVGGNFTTVTAATFTHTGTVTFDGGTGKELTSVGKSFNHLTLNKDAFGTALTMLDALDVDGKLTITQGTIVFGVDKGEHHFDGDFEIQTNGRVTAGTGDTVLVFDGTTNLTDGSSGSPQNLGAVKVD